MTLHTDQHSPSVETLLSVAEVAVDLSRLLAIDAAWTSTDALSNITAPGREKLAALGERIDAELATIDQRVTMLRDAFQSYPDWFNARIAEALTREELAGFQREDISTKLLAADRDFAVRAANLADFVIGRVPEEREDLRRKVHDIRGDGPVATDISLEMACGVGALASMGAMAAGVGLECPPLFFAGAVGLAVVIVAC